MQIIAKGNIISFLHVDNVILEISVFISAAIFRTQRLSNEKLRCELARKEQNTFKIPQAKLTRDLNTCFVCRTIKAFSLGLLRI